ncbi:MAG: RdgB/HAM1 family non-canonical purine NTP pyrophosphatase [Clostridia bacterium]|nr:RdgB/HAM1 family non-canonical purine NTP pyrophosphatase [Clostridia bacterium]
MKTIIAASNNKHKIHEIKEILKDSGYTVISLSEAGIDIDPEETSMTFEGNALIKARAAKKYTDLPVFADDSGLQVDCLKGLPGVKSKRFAGPDASDSDNNAYLIEKIEECNPEDTKARFICTIAYIDGTGAEKIFTGKVEGEIRTKAEGRNGFGYDPHFFVPCFNKTMAQMTDDEKNSISHRGRAVKKLRNHLIGTKT